MRKRAAWERRERLIETFDFRLLVLARGVKIRAAEYLGVSPATITRDVRALLARSYRNEQGLLWKIDRRLMANEIKAALAAANQEARDR